MGGSQRMCRGAERQTERASSPPDGPSRDTSRTRDLIHASPARHTQTSPRDESHGNHGGGSSLEARSGLPGLRAPCANHHVFRVRSELNRKPAAGFCRVDLLPLLPWDSSRGDALRPALESCVRSIAALRTPRFQQRWQGHQPLQPCNADASVPRQASFRERTRRSLSGSRRSACRSPRRSGPHRCDSARDTFLPSPRCRRQSRRRTSPIRRRADAARRRARPGS